MRYLTPLLPACEIFQSNTSSKSRYVLSENRSSVMRGRAFAFRQPSSIAQASPGGVFSRGSTQWFMEVPSKRRTQAPRVSSGVSVFGACAKATAQTHARSPNLRIADLHPAGFLRALENFLEQDHAPQSILEGREFGRRGRV